MPALRIGALALLFAGVLLTPKEARPEESASPSKTRVQWFDFPEPGFEVRGLPWFKATAPNLWRLPQSAKDQVPPAVWARAIAPDGGRIRFSSDTTRLTLRIEVPRPQAKACFFDAYVDGEPAGSVRIASVGPVEITLFENRPRQSKTITVYLPNNSEVRVLAIGLDPGASLAAPSAFALPNPLVCYGSSVLQGTGALRPSHTYPAALARRLNLDFINLGFGGAGKAEPEVVKWVVEPPACGFLFDLGKSYGAATPERYRAMLGAVRAVHPRVPIICVTPIYSEKEERDAAYKERSEALRKVMREEAEKLRQDGDRNIYVVEGVDLFGPKDKDLFADPLHPNDAGNERMAERLEPLAKRLFLKK